MNLPGPELEDCSSNDPCRSLSAIIDVEQYDLLSRSISYLTRINNEYVSSLEMGAVRGMVRGSEEGVGGGGGGT